MKTIDEIKDAIANSVWELIQRTECVDLRNWEIRIFCGAVDYFSESTPGGHVIFDGDCLDEQFEGSDAYNNWARDDVRRWVDCVVDMQELAELQGLTLTLEDCKTLSDVEKVVELTEWLDLSDEECHVRLMAVLKRAIELMDWSLDTAVLNCERLDTLARHDYAEIWAMFEDSEQGGPLPREKADMFCIHVGGLNLCGARYGTKYNDDGSVVLGWIEEALKLPPAANQEYQDGWYEDEWRLSEIAKGDAK